MEKGGWEWGTERVSYPACLGRLAQLLSCRFFVAKRPEHQEEEALLVNLISLAPGSLREGMGAALSIPIGRDLILNPVAPGVSFGLIISLYLPLR